MDYGNGISVIDSGYHRPGLAAFYLMRQGDQAAFIDTGTAHSLPHALAALRANGLAPEQVAYVIPTHVHLDHAGGAGAMMRQFPNAKLVVHPRGARHLIDPTKLAAGVAEVYGAAQAEKSFGTLIPIPAERVIEAPDEFALDFNGRPLLFLDTPGHARHHFCVVDQNSYSIFTGDTFGISYREFDTENGAFIFPTTTPVQFEPAALHTSIDRIVAHDPRQILLTHFGRVTESARLAAQMHLLIDAFAELALDVKNAGAQRHQRLIDGQRTILLRALRTHRSYLGDAEIDSILEMDLELNAQGMEVWLDRSTED
ncbi:MAG TPA: MBL fold metallo-hydrolase [Burkholderiales bacterium]|nr:MBL fold metallo-hydrolase [Burkholderiales bacterium]